MALAPKKQGGTGSTRKKSQTAQRAEEFGVAIPVHDNSDLLKVSVSEVAESRKPKVSIKDNTLTPRATVTLAKKPEQSLAIPSPFRFPTLYTPALSNFSRAMGIFFVVMGGALTLVNMDSLSTISQHATATISSDSHFTQPAQQFESVNTASMMSAVEATRSSELLNNQSSLAQVKTSNTNVSAEQTMVIVPTESHDTTTSALTLVGAIAIVALGLVLLLLGLYVARGPEKK